ncbi:MAG TPA: 2-phosphosulfolactate phosphatase [Isosphaeraceae bacterium]|jgi:2-phosphosulfolactate phosphatase|nr:2-phosphosulfolactate phosphatase [Isosphaeraceae bacterium]
MPERPTVAVHLLPSLIPPGALAGGVAVVVDVLRATTAMLHALAAGCEAVIPCLEVDDARKVAASLPPGTTILGGERGGVQIEGFDLGNSPASYTHELCRGKTLVITTTNGTRAILASLEAEQVYIAAFVNLKATVELLTVNLLKAQGRPMHIVCSGTEGFVSLEDTLLAGALTASLTDWDVAPANDSAILAAASWRATAHRLSHESLAKVLAEGRGGHNVRRIGLGPDIDDAAAVDRLNLTAVLRRDPLRIVKHS